MGLFPSLTQLTDERADAARRVLEELTEVVAADEYAVALGGKLPDLEDRAIKLLARPHVKPPPPPPPPPLPPRPGVVRERSYSALDRDSLREVTNEIEALFSEEPTARLDLTWRLRRKGAK